MEGIIKKYLAEKGYGFIKCASGAEYFFHVSNVKDQSSIHEGVRVKFSEEANEKGVQAKDILVVNTKIFIKIGKERIKLSNIKHYGVHQYEVRIEENIFENIERASREYSFLDKLKTFVTIPKKTIRYLYITTYQGDNYKFFDDEINFTQAIEELDAYFT